MLLGYTLKPFGSRTLYSGSLSKGTRYLKKLQNSVRWCAKAFCLSMVHAVMTSECVLCEEHLPMVFAWGAACLRNATCHSWTAFWCLFMKISTGFLCSGKEYFRVQQVHGLYFKCAVHWGVLQRKKMVWQITLQQSVNCSTWLEKRTLRSRFPEKM